MVVASERKKGKATFLRGRTQTLVRSVPGKALREPRFPFAFFSEILLLMTSVWIVSCSPGYLWHLGEGQARILIGMEPVEKYLKAHNVPAQVEKKIQLILDAKSFGEEDLGLRSSKNYTYFYEVKDPPLGYNLVASLPLELKAHRWCFPIAGCVPYKGFFDKNRVVHAGRKMREKGYDTYIRPFSAYSTLGWFTDPIFSTWLAVDDTSIVETVVHEMVHGTIYAKDQSDFNESVATFIGEHGATAFFREKRNEDCAFFEQWEEKRKTIRDFRDAMNRLAEQLRMLYASDLGSEDKLQKKKAFFQEARQGFEDGLPASLRSRYGRVMGSEWNNAFLVAHLTYHGDVSLWEDVLQRFGGDLGVMVAWLNEVKEKKDPAAYARSWLQGETGAGRDTR